MTLIEAVKAGKIRVQRGSKHIIWDGENWLVYKKHRGHVTPIGQTPDEETAVNALVEGK